MRNPTFPQLLAAATTLLMLAGLSGCGGGGGTTLAGGGTGGTGLGVVTGFGSVLIDDNRFDTDAGTKYFIDGEDVGKTRFEFTFGGTQGVGGAVALFGVLDVPSDDFVNGTLEYVDARTALKGPVTGTNPLQVLGQTVVVTGDTVLADLNNVPQLEPGNEVEVYGFTRADNVIQATRIQRKLQGIDEWKLTGFVNPTGGLAIAAQAISLTAGPEIKDCGTNGPAPRGFIEAKAVPVAGFRAGDALVVNKVECKAQGLIGELNDNVTLRRVQGFVSAVNAAGFTVGGTGPEGQSVRLTNTSTFRNGTLEDLVVGVKVEVTGRFNTGTGVLDASRVSFREARVRIEAPLQAVSGGNLTVLGLNVQGTALLEDDDNVLGNGQVGDNIRMRGFVDRNGTIFATRIDDRGDNTRDLRLRGPVDANSISQPNFRILGIAINPVGGTVYQDSRGANEDAPISQQQFFSILAAGQPVQVKGGTFSAGSIFIAGSIDGPQEIELED